MKVGVEHNENHSNLHQLDANKRLEMNDNKSTAGSTDEGRESMLCTSHGRTNSRRNELSVHSFSISQVLIRFT